MSMVTKPDPPARWIVHQLDTDKLVDVAIENMKGAEIMATGRIETPGRKPIEYDTARWGNVEKLIGWNELVGLWEPGQLSGEAPVATEVEELGLNITILGEYDAGALTLSGATLRVECIAKLIASPRREKCEPFDDVENPPFVNLNVRSNGMSGEVSLYNSEFITPTEDGRNLLTEGTGDAQAVLWFGTPHGAEERAPSMTLTQLIRVKIEELRAEYVSVSGDAVRMAQTFAKFLALYDDADTAKGMTTQVRDQMMPPLLSAMMTGEGTQSIKTGGYSINLINDIYPGKPSELMRIPGAIEALKEDNGDHLLKSSVNSQSWKKFVRDSVKDEDNKLPQTDEELAKRVRENLPHLSKHITPALRVFTRLDHRRAS